MKKQKTEQTKIKNKCFIKTSTTTTARIQPHMIINKIYENYIITIYNRCKIKNSNISFNPSFHLDFVYPQNFTKYLDDKWNLG